MRIAERNRGAFELVGFDAHAARTSAQQTVKRVLETVESVFIGTGKTDHRRREPPRSDETAAGLFGFRGDAAQMQRLHAFGHLVRHFARQPAEGRFVAQHRLNPGRRLMQHYGELHCRAVRVDDVPGHDVDRFGRQRAHQHAAVAIEDRAATRERLDRFIVLREREPRQMRAVANLHRR